jgi:ribonuclease HI
MTTSLFPDPPKPKPTHFVYTDGACEPNPGHGGWGFAVMHGNTEIHSEIGGQADTTNNVMEMMAVLKAAEWCEAAGLHPHKVKLYCDSQLVVKGCNSWRHSWRAKGWRRGPKAELKNAELWKLIDAALTRFPCEICWVRGHVGIPGNERADRLANEGRSAALAEAAA